MNTGENVIITNYCSTQDFENIKLTHSITNRFVDKQFRTVNESVFYSSKFENHLKKNNKLSQNSIVKWKRAKDFFKNSHFVLDQENRFKNLKNINQNNYLEFFHHTDLDQGILGR